MIKNNNQERKSWHLFMEIGFTPEQFKSWRTADRKNSGAGERKTKVSGFSLVRGQGRQSAREVMSSAAPFVSGKPNFVRKKAVDSSKFVPEFDIDKIDDWDKVALRTKAQALF